MGEDGMMICPFCEEGGFDEIGMCLHLSSDCRPYDRACRRTSDYMDRRTEPGADRP